MQKIKILLLSLGIFLFVVSPVAAFAPTIQTLPSYINNNSFKLSCTANGTAAQFMYKKEGGSYVNLGSSIDLGTSQCLVQVTSSEVNDQTKYYFKVNVDGTDSNEVSTTYDTNGPGAVWGYYKDGLGDGFRLHYHTPSDSDFSKVIIYRGDISGFSADSSHEISTINAGGNSDMTYEDHFGPTPGKTYYYLIRALDYAGNSSGLVGDSDPTVATTTGGILGASTGGTSGKVTQLPQGGSVLGDETEPSDSSEAATDENLEEGTDGTAGLTTNKRVLIGGGIVLLLIASYLAFRKK